MNALALQIEPCYKCNNDQASKQEDATSKDNTDTKEDGEAKGKATHV